MKQYYRDNKSWVELQRFLPAEYRWPAGYGPNEEFRPWRNSTLHQERFPNQDSSHKVILLHGVGTNSRLLNLIAGAPLARAGYEIVGIDMPFYGMTDNRESHITWADWVDIGADLVRREIAADGKPVVLYGLSAGGMLAYHIAAETRQVAGIMGMCFIDAASSVARRRMSARPGFDEMAFKLLPLIPDSVSGRTRVPMKLLVKMKALVNDPRALKLLLKDSCSAGASVSLQFVGSMIKYQPAIPFEAFDLCPILLLQPEKDWWTPFSVTEPFWERVKAPKEIVKLSNAGHYPVEQPGLDQMRDAMAGFIRALSSP